MADASLVDAATKTYIYGYPLLYNLNEIAKMPAGTATLAEGRPVPFNTFFPARALLDPPLPAFSDVPRSDPFYRYVETARAGGVISGYADGTFRPGSTATRGQIARIVYNAVTRP